MPRTKICVYKGCNSDTRHNHKHYMKGVVFYPFPKPKRSLDKCMRWLKWLGPLNWSITRQKDGFKVQKLKESCGVIVGLTIDKEFIVTYEALGKPLTNIQSLPKEIKNTTSLTTTINYMDTMKTCNGNTEVEFVKNFKDRKNSTGFISQITNGVHSVRCCLIETNEKRSRCFYCVKQRLYLKLILKRNKIKTDRSLTHFKNMDKDCLVANLKTTKCLVYKLKAKIVRLKKRVAKVIAVDGDEIGEDTHNVLKDVLDKNIDSKNCTNKDFAKIFLKTQQRMLNGKNSKCRRWHPLILQWCLFMYSKSPSLYRVLNDSGILKLPSKSTLNRRAPKIGLNPGFHTEVIQKVLKDLEKLHLQPHQEFFNLVIDEIKVKEDLVYRVQTGDVVGYTSLNDVHNRIADANAVLYKDRPITTHSLQFMIRGITSGFKYPIAYFATNSLTADQLDSLLMEAIHKFEFCGLKILCVTGDGASTNRKCFGYNTTQNEPHKCKNPASEDDRFLFFVFDPPHLIKTVRNGVANSTMGCKYRLLKINGEYITWDTIRAVYNRDIENGGNLRMLHKLTSQHINLENRMKVRFATQVISQSVANAIRIEFPGQYPETVRFLEIFNKWFDIMNVGHLYEGRNKANENLYPYTKDNDCRLYWLKEVFLPYLDEWETYVDNEPVNKQTKKKMLLPQETFLGLRQTTLAVLEMIPFLLAQGAPFVLSTHFNQDLLEQLFSRHRQALMAGSCPSILDYSRNGAKLQRMDEGNLKLKQSKFGNTE